MAPAPFSKRLLRQIIPHAYLGIHILEATVLFGHIPHLSDLGLDSLMTVELQTAIFTDLGVEFSAMELMKGGGTLAHAGDILTKLAIDKISEARGA